MQFKVFKEGIEVNGQTIISVLDGMGVFKVLSQNYLLKVGIGEKMEGVYKIDPKGWYPQEKWLKPLENIVRDIGNETLFQIGLSIPRNAKFPGWVTDIESAIRSINIAYHINHRRNGKIMFDQGTGIFQEGIGYYGFEKVPGKNIIISECRNPYPCDFDRGIITAMARKFQPNADITYDASKPCRKNGAESCTYVVTWYKKEMFHLVDLPICCWSRV